MTNECPWTVLIVDDCDAQRRRLREELQNPAFGGGFKTIELTSFDEDDIYNAIIQHKPDAIMLDIIDDNTGDSVGNTLVTYIRKDCKQADTPIIIITSPDRNPFEAAVDAIRRGANDIVFKDEDKAQTVNDRGKHWIVERDNMRKIEEARRNKQNVIGACAAGISALIQAVLGFVATQIPWFQGVLYFVATALVIIAIVVLTKWCLDNPKKNRLT